MQFGGICYCTDMSWRVVYYKGATEVHEEEF